MFHSDTRSVLQPFRFSRPKNSLRVINGFSLIPSFNFKINSLISPFIIVSTFFKTVFNFNLRSYTLMANSKHKTFLSHLSKQVLLHILIWISVFFAVLFVIWVFWYKSILEKKSHTMTPS